jgi:translation elongation factor EF-Ts
MADHVALAIGNVGENVSLRRCALLKTSSPDVYFAGYTHPAEEKQRQESIILGKFGSLLAYNGQDDQTKRQLFGRQLCQHIVGKCPLALLFF